MNILGRTGEDVITGFKGVITGHCKYITGCDQYLLQPKTDDNTKRPKGEWFDSNRIQLTKDDPLLIDSSVENGADIEAPTK